MSAENTKSFVKLLESTACMIFKWFSDNQLKRNGDKCHVLVTKHDANVNLVETENSNSEKLLRVILDSKLSFE